MLFSLPIEPVPTTAKAHHSESAAPFTPEPLYLLPLLLAAPQAHAEKALSVQFSISNTEGFNGVDPATLTLSKGNLSGTIEIISPGPATYAFTVNFGSTLIHDQLNLTCTIGPDEMVTLTGTLNRRSSVGKGTFSETFFKEQGTYKASSPN
jgi:hypothetical protein